MPKIIVFILFLLFTFTAFSNNGQQSMYVLGLSPLEIVWSNSLLTQQPEHATNKTLGGTATINGHIQNFSAGNIDQHNVTLNEVIAGKESYVDSTTTDASGNYTFTGLNAGSYRIYSGSQVDDYLNYRWDSLGNEICTIYLCIESLTSLINLSDPGSVSNIDFTVATGGEINGTLTDAVTLNGVGTFFVNLAETSFTSNYSLTSTIDITTGAYSITGIPDGDYKLFLDPKNSSANNLHIPRIYGGPECNQCNRLVFNGSGSILTINSANTIAGIDFSLNKGASISGHVFGNDTSSPLQQLGYILLFNESNYTITSSLLFGTNNDPAADGSYFIGGLLPGSYYVQGGDLGYEFYQRELYNDRPCYYSGCDRGTGDPVVLAPKEVKTAIDFDLDIGGKISGSLTDFTTGNPIVLSDGKRIQVEFYDATETVIGSAIVKTDGTYISARALPVGDYSARTGSMFQGDLIDPYINEKYEPLGNIECPGLACDLSSTNITVVAGTETTGINFSLKLGNSFEGSVTNLSSGVPIAGIHVLVYKDMGTGLPVKFANWATTSDGTDGLPLGDFKVSGLPDGTYYARTHTGSDLPFFASFSSYWDTTPLIGWIDILYNGLPCISDCDVTTGQAIVFPVVVKSLATKAAIPIVNFALDQGATIAGQVTDFTQDAPIKEVSIEIYNDQGIFMGSSFSDSQGQYITRGLPAGTYYLITNSFDVLLDVKYGNDFCRSPNCNPLDAQPITVTALEQKTNKNFKIKTAYMHVFNDAFE